MNRMRLPNAANPPTMTVCHALRNGLAVVNRPLMYSKTRSARSVTITEPTGPECSSPVGVDPWRNISQDLYTPKEATLKRR